MLSNISETSIKREKISRLYFLATSQGSWTWPARAIGPIENMGYSLGQAQRVHLSTPSPDSEGGTRHERVNESRTPLLALPSRFSGEGANAMRARGEEKKG
jgi:hypothetical protein